MKESQDLQRILIVYGTRPELIKLAPVVFALQERPSLFEVLVCCTAQHREMVDQMESVFKIQPDYDLNLMRPDQTLNSLAARGLTALDKLLDTVRPDWVLAQGDTTTVLVTALASFHLGIRIGHVEAGLRTGDLQSPFPEEANRRVTDLLADLLFTPTANASKVLLAEGCDPDKVFLTGNTVVDAVNWISTSLPAESNVEEVLITVHRRESFGDPLVAIFQAVRELASNFPEINWVYPVHRNPNVSRPAIDLLGNIPNVRLCDPLPYGELIRHMKRARLILTDSGGIQEEAPTFNKPVLVLREKTERPEGIAAGIARLVGTETRSIIEATSKLLLDDSAYRSMSCESQSLRGWPCGREDSLDPGRLGAGTLDLTLQIEAALGMDK